MFYFMYSHFHINSFSHVCKILVIVSGIIKDNLKKEGKVIWHKTLRTLKFHPITTFMKSAHAEILCCVLKQETLSSIALCLFDSDMTERMLTGT